jgi:hypothetical protein
VPPGRRDRTGRFLRLRTPGIVPSFGVPPRTPRLIADHPEVPQPRDPELQERQSPSSLPQTRAPPPRRFRRATRQPHAVGNLACPTFGSEKHRALRYGVTPEGTNSKYPRPPHSGHVLPRRETRPPQCPHSIRPAYVGFGSRLRFSSFASSRAFRKVSVSDMAVATSTRIFTAPAWGLSPRGARCP